MSLIHVGCKIKANICTAIFYCYLQRTTNPDITTESRDDVKVNACKGFTVWRTRFSDFVIPMLRKDSDSSVWPRWDFYQGFWRVRFHARRRAMLQCSSTVKKWKKRAELKKAWRSFVSSYTLPLWSGLSLGTGKVGIAKHQLSASRLHCYFNTSILLQSKSWKAMLEPHAGGGTV